MGFFNKIISSIFGHTNSPATAPATTVPASPGSIAETTAAPAEPSSAAAPVPATPATPAVQTKEVDVNEVMEGLAAKNSEKLDWKKSIVDLLKLLDIDSSLSARKELAAELHYTGDTSDSATMNIWLHKEVLKKVAQNGGKVPAELLD